MLLSVRFVIRRLLEHCDPDQLSGILDPVVKAATKLAKEQRVMDRTS